MLAEPASTVEAQDWSSLIVEAFPAASSQVTSRELFEKDSDEGSVPTDVVLETDGKGHVQLDISKMANGEARAWLVRLHLLPGETVQLATVDDSSVTVIHLEPAKDSSAIFPAGYRQAPAPLAGRVAELTLPSSSRARHISVQVVNAHN